MEPDSLIREYLLLGLRFDRIESGYVDAFTGDPKRRRAVENESPPRRSDLARRAEELLGQIPPDLDGHARTSSPRSCARWRTPGASSPASRVGFIDEVRAYFDVSIAKGDEQRCREAHARLDDALGGSGPLADRMHAYRTGDEIPPERLSDCINAFSSALRDRIRANYPLPDGEVVEYDVVTDKPWLGFNYYLGDYRSRIAVNADLNRQMSNLPIVGA